MHISTSSTSHRSLFFLITPANSCQWWGTWKSRGKSWLVMHLISMIHIYLSESVLLKAITGRAIDKDLKERIVLNYNMDNMTVDAIAQLQRWYPKSCAYLVSMPKSPSIQPSLGLTGRLWWLGCYEKIWSWRHNTTSNVPILVPYEFISEEWILIHPLVLCSTQSGPGITPFYHGRISGCSNRSCKRDFCIYSDNDIEQIESLLPTQPHRSVDLEIVKADKRFIQQCDFQIVLAWFFSSAKQAAWRRTSFYLLHSMVL